MALFRKKGPEIVRISTTGGKVEERKTLNVRGQKVEVRRLEAAPDKTRTEKRQRGRSQPTVKAKNGLATSRNHSRRPVDDEIIVPVESARKQMLVSVSRGQTQIVMLEGPVLVEHYVAREDSGAVAGNIYLAVTRNVLPGMEAAFLDFGASKNGVLYASDVAAQSDNGRAQKRIEQVLKEGDQVLVQVTKDAMGAKGARLTGVPSLPGRYLVLVPDSDNIGISRRLPDEDRARLRDVINTVRPPGFGVIVRTAAQYAAAEEIAADISRLVKGWERIREEAAAGGAPRLIHEEPELLIKVIREHFTADFRKLLIDDRRAYETVVGYLQGTAPDLVSKVQHYGDAIPLFDRYHVDDQLKKALDRKVYLPSGGHLVIDRTEALTVIDVNTGKFVGSSTLEDTVLQNNLEAAEEIGRQLRLRDIGGIIVIDFIDMESTENQQQVLRRLKETLARDKTRTQVFEVSNLGLVEMTRKNVSAGLLEQFSHKCEHCAGRGVIIDESFRPHAAPVDSVAAEVEV
ncbi:MAG: Rne/Rng family ribonuclease [Actinobacteria bacterium]|nr:Rne/Rng family ribonuclease [Actinomycetota bacterium]MCI0542878.1 Rne/Rng family ribonuclease [Actinomycetota bacterium]MCI0679197.1 Rne/Rng family ribonuclease [Actinomycetota bacterium]